MIIQHTLAEVNEKHYGYFFVFTHRTSFNNLGKNNRLDDDGNSLTGEYRLGMMNNASIQSQSEK